MTITDKKAFNVDATRDELRVLVQALDYVLDMDSESFTPFEDVLMRTMATAIERALKEE